MTLDLMLQKAYTSCGYVGCGYSGTSIFEVTSEGKLQPVCRYCTQKVENYPETVIICKPHVTGNKIFRGDDEVPYFFHAFRRCDATIRKHFIFLKGSMLSKMIQLASPLIV